ncbi:MAG TPA: pectate lyase [Bryobacteraceae bacterium]|nr:pectate lyase [Bryobacteraceae bacterium]
MRISISRSLFFCSGAAALMGVWAFAAVIGTNVAALPLTEERIASLPAAQQPAWRKYLERSAAQMRADRAALDAEMTNAGLKTPIIPPSESGAKSTPLDKSADWYGSAEARRMANIVVSFQTPAGGWSKNLNLADHVRALGEHWAGNNASPVPGVADFDSSKDTKWEYVGTLDNDATTTEIRFLAKVAAAGGDQKEAKRWRASLLKGIEYILEAQYPNGGWPQIWPLQGGYHDAITYNDDAMTRALMVLFDAANGAGEFASVRAELRSRARAAVAKGTDIILATQIVANGKRTAWGQQYDMLDLKPVGARNYEPPSLSSGETGTILLFLMSLPTPRPALVDAVRAGAAWLESVKIYGKAFERGPNGRTLTSAPGAGPIWSRYYEIGSNRPIFGDRDKSIHDDVNEISLERRNGYSWYNAGPKTALDRFAGWNASRH